MRLNISDDESSEITVKIVIAGKGGVSAKVPQKNGVLGYYLPFFDNFTHENDNFFFNKKEG